jgi:hypothetical protein
MGIWSLATTSEQIKKFVAMLGAATQRGDASSCPALDITDISVSFALPISVRLVPTPL